MRVALSTCLLVCAFACAPAREQPENHIDEAAARALVLKNYDSLFRHAYARDQQTGEYERYPTLTVSDLKYAEFRGDAWLVQADPPSGFLLRARVGKNGEWVEFTAVGFNDW